ncbi:MAG: acyltransferase [Pseudomonadota bacterium]
MSTPQPKGRNHWLDLMRGLAALLVCAGHLRAAIMVDLGASIAPGIPSKGLYLLTGLGHQSVMVFFVLSGYLVGGSIITAGQHFNWRHYAQARLSRLWTVLLPCLALTWVIDQVILHSAPQVLSGAYAPLWHSAPQTGQYDASWLTLLGNVFFVQTIAVPVFGSNGPLWSLANEFWYYVLFPLMTMVMMSQPMGANLYQRTGAALIVTLAFSVLPNELLFGYGVWLMGVAALVMHRRQPSPSQEGPTQWHQTRTALVVLIFTAGIAFSKWSAPKSWNLPWGDWALGMAVCVFIVHGVHPASSSRWPRWMRSAVEHVSDLSFSLYLSHFPVVMLIGASRYLDQRMQPSIGSWLTLCGWLGLLLLVGHLMWWLFERHTPVVRRCMSASPQHTIRTTSAS